MSKFLKPSLYSQRALENQYINAIYGIHDLWCGCLKPIQHANEIINREKCHSTKDTGTGTDDLNTDTADTEIGLGDLEKLFEESDDTTG